MNFIYKLFEFNNASIGSLCCRFGSLLLLAVAIVWLVSFVLLQFTKNKKHEIGFSNWFKVCFLWGIVAAVLVLGIVSILTIRANGLYYFGSFSLSWYCGYVLMLPEAILMILLVVAYFVISNRIHKSIN